MIAADVFSSPVRLMARPFRTYRELSSDPDLKPSFIVGALRFLLVVGGFVAITATGRLAPLEMAFATASFTWIPLVHAIAMAITIRALAPPKTPFRRAFAFYLEALGPWIFVFLILAGLCLFVPEPAGAIFTMLGPLLLLASGWSIVIVFAFFRVALSLSRGRAAGATALFYFIVHALIIGYYFAMGQLWPIL